MLDTPSLNGDTHTQTHTAVVLHVMETVVCFSVIPFPVHFISTDEIGTGSGEGERVSTATGSCLPPP